MIGPLGGKCCRIILRHVFDAIASVSLRCFSVAKGLFLVIVPQCASSSMRAYVVSAHQ